MTFNWYIPFLAALIPLVIGFIWYNPKVFGTAWMNASGMTEEKAKGANMPLIFGLTYLFSLMMCLVISSSSIHQFHLFSLFAGNPDFKTDGSETQMVLQGLMEKYGTNFRTFKHGVFHGVLLGLFIGLPIIGINALFERKGFKYIAINVGYFIVSIALMGGLLCCCI